MPIQLKMRKEKSCSLPEYFFPCDLKLEKLQNDVLKW